MPAPGSAAGGAAGAQRQAAEQRAQAPERLLQAAQQATAALQQAAPAIELLHDAHQTASLLHLSEPAEDAGGPPRKSRRVAGRS